MQSLPFRAVARQFDGVSAGHQQDQWRYAQNAAFEVRSRSGPIARCFYNFFVVVVIMYKTKAPARRALTFIVGILVNDTIAIAVWTSFDTIAIAVRISFHPCVPPKPILVERGRAIASI